MFLQIDDLKNSIYNYQVDQITEGDESIVIQALMTAEEECKSYLYLNNKREVNDGRLQYDVEAIFSAQGDERNALIVQHCINIAKWYIVDLCNVDILYEQAKERYDRSISWLKQLNNGSVSLNNLPQLNPDNSGPSSTTTDNQTGIIYGSRAKFNHE